MVARAQVIATLLLAGGLAGCANDPLYLPSPTNMEAGVDDGTGALSEAKSSLVLPIKPETTEDATARMKLADELGVMVPYVKLGDLDLEVEWTIKNLDPMPGQAKIELNGANEWFTYDPSVIVLDADDDEAPPTPGLAGDIPIDVPGDGEVSGVFREDQLEEASIDLDQITRGNVNPFAAMLTVNKHDDSFQPLSAPMTMNPTCQQDPDDPTCQQQPTGPAVPREAFASIVRVDLVFEPDRHMVLDYTVRVRDHRGILHDHGVDAPADEIVTFQPTVYMP
jgi:hypothetical protein